MLGLLALLLVGTVSAQGPACRVLHAHVTLGDYFSLTPNQNTTLNAFTLGITTADCSVPPRASLLDASGSTLQHLQATWSKGESTPMPDGSVYDKRAYFFSVPYAAALSAHSWQVTNNGRLIFGPATLAKKALLNDGDFKAVIVADMDLTVYSTETIARMKQWNLNDYDVFMHLGDFAYEIEDDGGQKGDDFFEAMNVVTKSLPYIITPGNHENYDQGALFNYRFIMPNSDPSETSLQQNHYFDFLVKDHYFISVNFEFPLWLQPHTFASTLNWMKTRLEIAQNNTNIRWKVFLSHRPIFCNDLVFTGDCTYNLYALQAFQDLFIRYNLTVMLNGHLHIYSRLKPMTNFRMMPLTSVGKGSYLQVISGHAGTEHYFPNSTSTYQYELPMVAKVDLTGPTYLEIALTPDTFEGRLRLSLDDSVLDSFEFETNLPKKHYPLWVFYTLISLAAVFAIAVVIIMIVHLRTLKRMERSTVGQDDATGQFRDNTRVDSS